jgi:hypothetical protein
MDENRDREVNRDVVDVAEERRERDEQVRENRAPAATAREELVPLFEDEDAKRFRNQWLSIQSKFVDDPRESVKQADDLVAGVLKSVTMGFSDRRVALEKQWNSGENISTEDLRVALKRYRSFFDRLLTLES